MYYHFLYSLRLYISCVTYHTPKITHYFEFGLDSPRICKESNVTERLSLKEHPQRPGLSPRGAEAGAHPVKAGFRPEGNQQDFLVEALE